MAGWLGPDIRSAFFPAAQLGAVRPRPSCRGGRVSLHVPRGLPCSMARRDWWIREGRKARTLVRGSAKNAGRSCVAGVNRPPRAGCRNPNRFHPQRNYVDRRQRSKASKGLARIACREKGVVTANILLCEYFANGKFAPKVRRSSLS
jgi:hypothetical protein